jgi:putative sterol carrier protein
MDVVTSVQHYLDTLPQRFRAEGAKGVNAVYQFNLGGEGGQTFHVLINDGTMSVGQGPHASPTVTLTATAANYLKLVNGTLNGQLAFATGKLKIAGSIPAALKLQKILPQNS